ncbi:MAG: C39 family peptidase, partial [Chloroflexota bacterium]
MPNSVKLLLLVLGVRIGFALAPAAWAQATPPESASISGLVGHPQTYRLSCESRSAADWAAFWGVPISETEFFDRLPQSDNPEVGFVGNVHGPWGHLPPEGYGVHAAPVATLLREYGLAAEARYGLAWSDLQAEIAAGRPAIVWIVGRIWAGAPESYLAQDGSVVTVARYEHTMILVGYDATTVTLVDAADGRTHTYRLADFLTSWAVLGNMAVVGNGPSPAATPS